MRTDLVKARGGSHVILMIVPLNIGRSQVTCTVENENAFDSSIVSLTLSVPIGKVGSWDG